MSKYSSRKAVEIVDGKYVTFDSTVERDRYLHLRILERIGHISALELQPVYELQEGYVRHGKKIQAEKYKGDFRYIKSGEIVVEDVKGMRLPMYLSKLKRLLYLHPELNFIEVTRKQKQWEEIIK